MNPFFKIAVFTVMALACSSCIDELNVDTEQEKQLLVVEGAITTQPGRHRILLSKSAKYGSIFDGLIEKEAGATVWIRDSEGGQVFLTETAPGSYSTPTDYHAQVGLSYTLFINLSNGERYISIPEKVVPAPAIDTLLVLTKEQPSLGQVSLDRGLEVYVQWQDPTDVDNFYMWEAEGIYLLNTHPELHETRDGNGNITPDPLDCCDRCYVSEFDLNTVLRLFKDNLTNGKQNTEIAAYIPDDGKRFMEKYMIAVKQQSLTKEAYQFLDLMKNQLSIQGNIFDPPPATIRGNMISLDNPDDSVIGFFRASDVQTDTIFVRRDQIESPLQILQINDDCRVFKNSTTERPPFWN